MIIYIAFSTIPRVTNGMSLRTELIRTEGRIQVKPRHTLSNGSPYRILVDPKDVLGASRASTRARVRVRARSAAQLIVAIIYGWTCQKLSRSMATIDVHVVVAVNAVLVVHSMVVRTKRSRAIPRLWYCIVHRCHRHKQRRVRRNYIWRQYGPTITISFGWCCSSNLQIKVGLGFAIIWRRSTSKCWTSCRVIGKGVTQGPRLRCKAKEGFVSCVLTFSSVGTGEPFSSPVL